MTKATNDFSIDDCISELRLARFKIKQSQEKVVRIENEIAESALYAKLQEAKNELRRYQEIEHEFDYQVRGLALGEYAVTGDKKPHPKVSIAISKSLEYNPERAIRWAAANDALYMLKLNTRDFEKHARAVADTVPLEFVEVEDKPMVKIAKEL